MTTCMPSSDNFSYMMLNLVGELGEFAGKVAKAIRKQKVTINNDHLESGDISFAGDLQEMMKEAGDVLWQLSGLCKVMGWSLEDVAALNLRKLADRKGRGVIDGNGDER